MGWAARSAAAVPPRAAVVCTLLALALRVIYLIDAAGNPFWRELGLDLEIYDRWARAVAGGQGLGEAPFTQAPFFPLALGVTYALLGPDPVRALWAQLLPGALTVFAVAWSAERLFGRRAAWVSGLLLALYKPAIYFTGVLLPSTWAACLAAVVLWLAVWLWVHAGEIQTRRASMVGSFGALGFCAGLLGLAQPTSLGIALPLLASMLWSRGRSRLVLLAAFLLPLAASFVYNGAAGAWSLVAVNRGINLYIGNGPEANGTYVRPPGTREDRDLLGRGAAESALRARGDWPSGEIHEGQAGGAESLSLAAADRYWTRAALEAVSRAPLRTAGLFLRKLGYTIAECEIPQVESQRFESRFSRLLRVPLPGMALLLGLAAMGAVLRWDDARVRRLALAWLGGALFIAIFFVTGRFRLVLVPVLALLAGGAVGDVHRVSRARVIVAASFGVAALLLSLLAARGIGVRLSDGQYLFRLGVLAERAKDVEAAKRRYAEALAIDPSLGKAEVNLGTLLGREGRLEEARAHLERGLSLDPETAIGRVSLAQLAQINGERERALALYSEARSLDPNLVSAAEGVAYLGYELGRIEESAIVARSIATATPPESAAARRARGLLAILDARARLGDQGWKGSAALRAADLLAARGRGEEALVQYRAWVNDAQAGAAARATMELLQGGVR
ncbi:MAG: hypothetical protein U0527_04670 [Candidatus Eisenbacteria bacterium]